MTKSLWIEAYRPKTIDEYVFKDAGQKRQVSNWIKERSIPHLLFSGAAGIGKTTLAKVLINEIGIEDYDVLEIYNKRDHSFSSSTLRKRVLEAEVAKQESN